jgi:hypothetical protein
MKIANIIYEKELVNHTQVDYINYFTGLTEYNKLDKTMPTLYVGWSLMKACNPNNELIQHADILKKRIITNELYWECSFEESKSSHVKGVENFVNLVPQFYFTPKYQFINLDPVFFQIVDVQGILDVVSREIDILYNFKNEMLYVLSKNNITAINLKMYAFFGFYTEEIIRSLSDRTTKCTYDLEGSTYQSYYKILPNFNLLKRYLITMLPK